MQRVYTRHLLMGLLLVLGLLAGGAPALAVTEKEALGTLEAMQTGFRAVHGKVTPAVVSISSRMEVSAQPADPLEFFFGSPRPQVRQSSGSGVIIRPEGIVLTNSHVVQNATKVTVQLSGDTKSLAAEVVQTDPRTDLAIVRITEKGTYPVAKLGDASTVQVGDWAIAFGSPFGLASTMTVGVISATGRQLRSPNEEFAFRDLLQTDASINPGNSGGPLVNTRGEIIGVNFMIYSPGQSAGSVGIGFAIPINAMTKEIIDMLASGKAYARGRLGVVVKNLDEALREATGVKDGGVFVDSVMPGMAAEKAGIRDEDVITSYNGVKITDVDQFVSLVERTRPGTVVAVVLMRKGKEVKLDVTVAAVPTSGQSQFDERRIGASVRTLTPEIVEQLRLPAGTMGVLVTGVLPGSVAYEAGLQRGDIILRVGAEEVRTEEDFWGALSEAGTTNRRTVLLRVRRGRQATTITLPIPSSPSSPQAD
jgi:serine protease Do